MKQKKTAAPAASDTKVNRVLSQAKESLKLFERMELQAIGRARRLIRISLASKPRAARSKSRAADARLLLSLKKLGIATAADLQELKDRLTRVEAALELPKSRAPTPVVSDHASAVPRA